MNILQFILSARSDCWRVPSLSDVDILDWTDMKDEVSEALLSWVYTDNINFTREDRFTLDLMAAASGFRLTPLVDRCEETLMSSGLGQIIGGF